MVKKLIQQRRHTGSIAVRYANCGRKPRILESHRHQMRGLLSAQPDMTLEELRSALGLSCSLVAIHVALAKMDMTYKKRRSQPVSKAGPTSRKPEGFGAGSKAGLTRRG